MRTSGPRRLLLLIDQFEHLFTQCPDEAERQRLVGALHGTTLSAAAPDGTIARWDVAYTVDPVAYACASAGRSLTRAEWARYVQGLPYQDTCP